MGGLSAETSKEFSPLFDELKKANPPCEGTKSPPKIPAAHEGAIKHIEKIIKTAREQLTNICSRNNSAKNHTVTPASKLEDGDNQQQDGHSASKPKEKPFGANRNIHTLGCFSNESSKPLKNLGAGGRIIGFKP